MAAATEGRSAAEEKAHAMLSPALSLSQSRLLKIKKLERLTHDQPKDRS